MSYLDKTKFHSCDCGTQVEDDFFQAKQHYSKTGWFFITIMGTTWNPKQIDLTCTRCNKTFQEINDPELIKYFELYKKR